MRNATTYEIISLTPKPEMKIPEKLQLILSHESIGNKFTISEILNKYDTLDVDYTNNTITRLHLIPPTCRVRIPLPALQSDTY